MTVPATVETVPGEPFRGFEPYRYVDQRIFFARERQVRQLLRQVVVYRGVMLFGESGAGKSSLINAGLIPAAIDEHLAPERLRVQPRQGEEFVVERIPIEEGIAPKYLPSILSEDSSVPRVVYSAEELDARLRSLDADRVPLLIVDQFEELVTLFQEVPTATSPKERGDAQGAVVDVLLGVLRDHYLAVKVLLAFREDYLAKVVDLLAGYPQLTAQSMRLTPPDVDEVPEIVSGPFKRFPDHFKEPIDDSLARRLAEDFRARSVTGRVSLSELQAVCQRLWRDPDAERLLDEQGVQGILELALAESLARLDDAQRFVALALLSRMVTASGARNVVSEEDLIERVANEDSIAEDDLRAGLAALESETRLVRREVRHGVPFYEITSEFLAPWIARQRVTKLKDEALSVDQLQSRQRLQTELTKASSEARAARVEDRLEAVRRLVSIAIRSMYLDPRVSAEVNRVLHGLVDTDDSISVRKEAAKGVNAIRAMHEDEEVPWGPPRPAPPPGAPPPFPARLNVVGWTVTLIAFVTMSAFPMVIGGALVERIGRDLGGPELPDVWIWVTVVASFVWAFLYLAEALDALVVRRNPIGAPFHPYEYGAGLIERSAGWPAMLLIAVIASYAVGWGAWEAGLMFSVVWYVAFAVVNILGLLDYRKAVGLQVRA